MYIASVLFSPLKLALHIAFYCAHSLFVQCDLGKLRLTLISDLPGSSVDFIFHLFLNQRYLHQNMS